MPTDLRKKKYLGTFLGEWTETHWQSVHWQLIMVAFFTNMTDIFKDDCDTADRARMGFIEPAKV